MDKPDNLNSVEQAQYWANNVGYFSAKRPTELAALKLWQCGFVNLRHYFGRYGFLIHHIPPRTRNPELEAEQRTHRRAYGQKCNDCGRRRPLNEHYWRVDCKQRRGFKTICKICDKKERLKIS